MANLFEERAGLKLASTILVTVFVSSAICQQVSGFPSLFSMRAQSIFKGQPQTPPISSAHSAQQLAPFNDQQSAHLRAHQAHTGSATSMIGSQLVKSAQDDQQLQFGASHLLPAELLRINTGLQQQQQQAMLVGSAASHHPQQQRHFLFDDHEHTSAQSFGRTPTHSAGFYVTNSPVSQPLASGGLLEHGSKPALASQDQASFDLTDHTNYFHTDIRAASLRPANKHVTDASHQMRLEPSHTSEIVDKIEQHIGQQVERSLAQHANDGHQQQRQTAAASGYQHGDEKETAQSEEQEETAGGHGGESSAAAADEHGEEKLDKRHEEEPHKEHHHAEHQPHHQKHESHEESPPEAFEVHHKKGGKSFQYFHQGHHHHHA